MNRRETARRPTISLIFLGIGIVFRSIEIEIASDLTEPVLCTGERAWDFFVPCHPLDKRRDLNFRGR